MNTQALQKAEPRSLKTQLAERNITNAQWHTLSKSLYPGAKQESVLLVIDYCQARKLDPLKKPAHIVPMYVKDAATGRSEMRDVILPGIYELRTTAARTGEYLGHSKPTYGPVKDHLGVQAPEWCEMTMYRHNSAANCRVEFPVRVVFAEVVGVSHKTGKPNARWTKAPVQMLTKCAEAAGLREGWPDEIGHDLIPEEVIDQPRAMIEQSNGTTLAEITGAKDPVVEVKCELGTVDQEMGIVKAKDAAEHESEKVPRAVDTVTADHFHQLEEPDPTTERPDPGAEPETWDGDENATTTEPDDPDVTGHAEPHEWTPSQVQALIDAAKTGDDINDAMDLIKELAKGERREEVKSSAIRKYEEIMG